MADTLLNAGTAHARRPEPVSDATIRNTHHYPVAIEASDIDFMGHVNNASYLRWVQAAVLQLDGPPFSEMTS